MSRVEPPALDWEDVPGTQPAPARNPRPVTSTYGALAAEAARAGLALKTRVLRYPDIAARLCEPPLRYTRPEVWNGYIPPETWQGKHNNSPQRTALLEIITAAIEADKEGGS